MVISPLKVLTDTRAPPPPMVNSIRFVRPRPDDSDDGSSRIGITLSTLPLQVLTLNVAPDPSGIVRRTSPECDLNS